MLNVVYSNRTASIIVIHMVIHKVYPIIMETIYDNHCFLSVIDEFFFKKKSFFLKKKQTSFKKEKNLPI